MKRVNKGTAGYLVQGLFSIGVYFKGLGFRVVVSGIKLPLSSVVNASFLS